MKCPVCGYEHNTGRHNIDRLKSSIIKENHKLKIENNELREELKQQKGSSNKIRNFWETASRTFNQISGRA